MNDRAKFEQMLESLINGDQKQAEDIFHDLVVAKSREIYENLLDDDYQVDEASEDDEVKEDDDVEEGFDMGMDEVGGDAADSMIDAVVADGDDMGGMDDMGGDDMAGGDEPATKDDVMDIKDALDELKAEFEAMLAGDSNKDMSGDDSDMDDEESADDEEDDKKEGYQFEGDDEDGVEEDMVREYVEKVAPAKMGDNGVGGGMKFSKNNMGGTSSNTAQSGESTKGGTQGGLANPATKDLNSGNVNTPGSKTATKMHPTKGHGAERKGSGDNGANTRSIVGR